jgi:hypothetical protein
LAAVDYWRSQALALETDDVAALRVEADDVPPGSYDFFLFKLDVVAVTPSLTFEPIALSQGGRFDEGVSRILLRLLVAATSDDAEINEQHIRQQRQRAEAIATSIRAKREAEAMSRNEALLSLRSEAINRAEQAKLRRAEEYIQRVSEPRILRMKQREIENIEASRKARLSALEEKRSVLVSIQEAAAGRLRVVAVTREVGSREDIEEPMLDVEPSDQGIGPAAGVEEAARDDMEIAVIERDVRPVDQRLDADVSEAVWHGGARDVAADVAAANLEQPAEEGPNPDQAARLGYGALERRQGVLRHLNRLMRRRED